MKTKKKLFFLKKILGGNFKLKFGKIQLKFTCGKGREKKITAPPYAGAGLSHSQSRLPIVLYL